MSAIRIIPCLDMSDGRVVKGVNFVNIKDVGDPAEIAALYEKEGADELAFLDINATMQSRGTMLDAVERVAGQISIPFTVGGGIRSIEDIRDVLKAGADKVSINSAAIKRPELISEAEAEFGSQRIIVAIDAKKRKEGNGYYVYVNGGTSNTGRDAVAWALEAERLGAGEILLTSIDFDGTKNGYDIELTKSISENVRIPVIASGGAGTKEHFYEALTVAKADAVLAASLFHFRELEISDLKQYLKNKGIEVRL